MAIRRSLSSRCAGGAARARGMAQLHPAADWRHARVASFFHTIGHITRDRVGGTGGGREQAGGAARYAALTLRRLGERMAVTTRMASPDRPVLLAELKAAGAEVTARQDMLASRPRTGHASPGGNTLPRSPGVAGHDASGSKPRDLVLAVAARARGMAHLQPRRGLAAHVAWLLFSTPSAISRGIASAAPAGAASRPAAPPTTRR